MLCALTHVAQVDLRARDPFAPESRDLARVVAERGYRAGWTREQLSSLPQAVAFLFHHPTRSVRGALYVSRPDASDRRALAGPRRRSAAWAFPFVEGSRVFAKPGAVDGDVLTPQWHLRVILVAPPDPPADDALRADLEAILRASAAVYAGRGARTGRTVLAGRPVETLTRGERPSVRAVALPGVRIAIDRDRHLWRLTRPGRELVLPIGSDRVRRNGIWRAMAEVAPLRNGSLYVPLDLARWIAGG